MPQIPSQTIKPLARSDSQALETGSYEEMYFQNGRRTQDIFFGCMATVCEINSTTVQDLTVLLSGMWQDNPQASARRLLLVVVVNSGPQFDHHPGRPEALQ